MNFSLSPDQETFVEVARTFARERVAPRAAAIDESGAYPIDLVREAAALGLAAPTIDPAWGGGGRDHVSYALAIEAVAAASATLAVILTINNSLVAELLQQYGTDAQKKRWLGALASGAGIGAFAL